jgi:hypothetical protein
VIVLALVLTRCSARGERPPQEFLDAELTAGDAAQTGTCYSLGVVLTANYGRQRDAVKKWEQLAADRWRFTFEAIQQEYGGGPQAFTLNATFERGGTRVRPVEITSTSAVDASVLEAMRGLMEAPDAYGSTKVDRCQQGGTGYKF